MDNQNKSHRWSGWPGAWCLYCDISDPAEYCVANHEENCTDVACNDDVCSASDARRYQVDIKMNPPPPADLIPKNAEHCAICDIHLDSLCFDCNNIKKDCHPDAAESCRRCSTECMVGIGECGHVFHFHCISDYIRRNTRCFICHKVWEFKRYGYVNKN